MHAGKHVKYKPPAPDPDPAPPDLQVTNEWIKQVLSGSNKSGHAAIDCSDSGCSSLGSTTTSPMTSGICTTRLDSQGSPNLLGKFQHTSTFWRTEVAMEIDKMNIRHPWQLKKSKSWGQF